jgi:hypothetical protein
VTTIKSQRSRLNSQGSRLTPPLWELKVER